MGYILRGVLIVGALLTITNTQAVIAPLLPTLDCPAVVRVGSPILIVSSLQGLSRDEFSSLKVTWSSSGDEIGACSPTCIARINGAAFSLQYVEASSSWLATVDGLTDLMGSSDIELSVMWEVGNLRMDPLGCTIAKRGDKPTAKEKKSELECHYSFAGYPLILNGAFSLMQFDIEEIKRMIDEGPNIIDLKFEIVHENFDGSNRTLWARSKSMDGSILYQSSAIEMSVSLEKLQLYIVLTIVADLDHRGRWFTRWSFFEYSVFAESMCNVNSMPFADGVDDCLKTPILRFPPRWTARNILQITLVCFTRTMQTIRVSGDYTNTFQSLDSFEPNLDFAILDLIIKEDIKNQTNIQVILDVFFEGGGSMKTDLLVPVGSTQVGLPSFSGNLHGGLVAEFTKVNATILMLALEKSGDKMDLEIIQSFPVSFDTFFSHEYKSKGIFNIILREPIAFGFYHFPLKFFAKVTNNISGQSSYTGIQIQQVDSKQYPVVCSSQAYFVLDSNIKDTAIFVLPCSALDEDRLYIEVPYPAHHLQLKPVRNTIHVSAPIPVPVSEDSLTVQVRYSDDDSFARLVQVVFRIRQFPPMPLLHNTTISTSSATLTYQVAPNISVYWTLVEQGVIQSFQLRLKAENDTSISSFFKKADGVMPAETFEKALIIYTIPLDRKGSFETWLSAYGELGEVTTNKKYFFTPEELIPPIPVLHNITTRDFTATLIFEVAPNIPVYQNLVEQQIIQSFELSISIKSWTYINSVKMDINDVIQDAESKKALIIFTPWFLFPSEQFDGSLIVKTSSPETDRTVVVTFLTKPDTPQILSPFDVNQVVPYGTTLELLCRVHSYLRVRDFRWIHNGNDLEKEKERRLRLSASEASAGIYQCHITDYFEQREFSDEHNLLVAQPEILPPIPVLHNMTTSNFSATLIFEVAPNNSVFLNLVEERVIITFEFVLTPENEFSITFRQDATGVLPGALSDKAFMRFTPDLLPSRRYNGSLLVTGKSEQTVRSDPFVFITKPVSPRIISPYLDNQVISYGEAVTLTCDEGNIIRARHFGWIHNGTVINDEDTGFLLLYAIPAAVGLYQCHITDNFDQTALSEVYTIKISGPDYNNSINISTSITLQENWNRELKDASSVQFVAAKSYVESLVTYALKDWYTFVRSEVISFRQGSVIADVVITDQSNPSNIIEYLHHQLETPGFSLPFDNNEAYLHLNGMTKEHDGTALIEEGKPVRINCHFMIVQSGSERPKFDVAWSVNQSAINQMQSQTFTFQKNYTTTSNFTDLVIYNYIYTLTIKEFSERLLGQYQCTIAMSALPPVGNSNGVQSQAATITVFEILLKPSVRIDPLLIQVADLETNVRVQCFTENSDTVVVINSRFERISRTMSVTNRSWSSFSVRADLMIGGARCLAEQGNNRPQGISDYCQIHVINNGSITCPANVDDRGQYWEESDSGLTNVKPCPSGYTGKVTRKCLESGRFEDSNYDQCYREELQSAQNEITNINQDGVEPSKDQITQISKSTNDGVSNLDSVDSEDIKITIDILNEVGKAVINDQGQEQTGKVSNDALENFANTTDIILSVDDSKWQEITRANATTAETEEKSNTNIGSQLVIAMDRIASSTFENNVSATIVKKHIAIKTDEIGARDIVFPDKSETKYNNFDGWVKEQNSKIFLSAKNFENAIDKKMQYAVLLYRNITNKLIVQPDKQKEHDKFTEELKDKEVVSEILSFTLSKRLTSLDPPLQLRFQIVKENVSEPSCGFMDTSLGPQPVWSTQGCQTVGISEDFVECECNHLTNFAILMNPYGTLDGKHHEILSIITYVGCGLSILCLVITIIMHIILWKYVKDDRAVLHLNLCVLLILAFVAFLAGVNQTEYDVVCTVVAALLHFFFLAVFFTMLAEGLQIFISVTFVFSKESHLKKLLFMAYAFPIVIVAACLGISLAEGYRSSDFCWLNLETGYLWAFVGPALFVILANFIILLIALNKMMSTKSMAGKDFKTKTKSVIRAIFVLSPIFGITWVFGVLSFNESLVVFQYLFAIFNTLQGVFVFFFYCVMSKQMRDGMRHLLRKHRSRTMHPSDQVVSSSGNQATDSSSKGRRLSDSTKNQFSSSSQQTGRSTQLTNSSFSDPRAFGSSKGTQINSSVTSLGTKPTQADNK